MPDETEFKPAVAPAVPPQRPSRIGNFRTSAAQFLVALVLLLFAAPFVDALENGETIDGVLFTLVLILGVLAVGRSHRKLAFAAVLMVPAVAAKWISYFRPDLLPPLVHNALSLVFICFVEVQFLLFVLRAPRVNSEVLCAGISGYLLLGIVWMSAYLLVSRLHPNPGDPQHPAAFAFSLASESAHPFTSFQAYYFSFITLSTVGYGDITPVSNAARMLAMMEAITGTLYIAVLISRLVALYSAQPAEPVEPKS